MDLVTHIRFQVDCTGY